MYILMQSLLTLVFCDPLFQIVELKNLFHSGQ